MIQKTHAIPKKCKISRMTDKHFFFKVFFQVVFHCQKKKKKTSNFSKQVTHLGIAVFALYQRPFHVPCAPDGPKKPPSKTLGQLRNSSPCRCFTVSPVWGYNPMPFTYCHLFSISPHPSPIANSSPGSLCPFLGAEAPQRPRRAGVELSHGCPPESSPAFPGDIGWATHSEENTHRWNWTACKDHLPSSVAEE